MSIPCAILTLPGRTIVDCITFLVIPANLKLPSSWLPFPSSKTPPTLQIFSQITHHSSTFNAQSPLYLHHHSRVLPDKQVLRCKLSVSSSCIIIYFSSNLAHPLSHYSIVPVAISWVVQWNLWMRLKAIYETSLPCTRFWFWSFPHGELDLIEDAFHSGFLNGMKFKVLWVSLMYGNEWLWLTHQSRWETLVRS